MAKEIKITIDSKNLELLQSLKTEKQNLSDILNQILIIYPQLVERKSKLEDENKIYVENCKMRFLNSEGMCVTDCDIYKL